MRILRRRFGFCVLSFPHSSRYNPPLIPFSPGGFMSMCKALLAIFSAVALTAAQVHAAVVLPAKAYTKMDEPIVVKFLNEKGEDGKQAVTAFGVEAGKLDALFSPASAADIVADGKPNFKIFSPDGKELTLAALTPAADGSVDLSAACPDLKTGGGTYYLVWKDAAPLVIETLYNPGRGKTDLAKLQPQIDQLPADRKSQQLAEFAPVVMHMELAETAVITTDKGIIKAKFSYEYAPHTVDNFISLSRQGFYDGSAFHRIISGFMLQGGDAYANTDKAGTGGPGYDVMHEFTDKKHERGTLSMARSSPPGGASNALDPSGSSYYDTDGSQFFIMHQRASSLDGQYSAFGDVFDGMDIVDAIAKTPVADDNGTVAGPRPKIISIKIVPGTAEIYGLKK